MRPRIQCQKLSGIDLIPPRRIAPAGRRPLVLRPDRRWGFQAYIVEHPSNVERVRQSAVAPTIHRCELNLREQGLDLPRCFGLENQIVIYDSHLIV